jgi:N-acetyl-anhydromuramyl-L-alanine amidase AmpD
MATRLKRSDEFGRLQPVTPGVVFAVIAACLPGCHDPGTTVNAVGRELERGGDEIVVCGRLFHTGTRVVLWSDPGGFDAYRVHRRFSDREQTSPRDGDSPHRYGDRRVTHSADEAARIEDIGWTLDDARAHIDQFVLHYDVCGTSRRCFEVLHDLRGLSVHFMLDIDGTIYQTLDVKERAWHAGTANDRSVGIEIAHIGAYPESDRGAIERWYRRDAEGWPILTPPADWRPIDARLAGGRGDVTIVFDRDSLRSARPDLIGGEINGRALVQFDYTDAQYEALIRLTATLSAVLSGIGLDAPRDADGRVVPGVLDEAALADFRGVLGHYHITRGKIDPGPAMDWDRLLEGARRLRR